MPKPSLPEGYPAHSETVNDLKDHPQLSLHHRLEAIKETISSSARYAHLKLKEFFGAIGEAELDEILSFEFQRELRDNPPIQGIFAPTEELTRIRALPAGEKKEALTLFENRLARQKTAWAVCRTFIERYIIINPDIPKVKLLDVIENFSHHYGFSPDQQQIAEGVLGDYYEARQRVLGIREKLPDNVDLVNELTGMSFRPKTDFEVSVGPATIDIVADGAIARQVYDGSETAVAIPPRSKFTAFLDHSKHDPPIYFVIIDRDQMGMSKKPFLRHEYEHRKDAFFIERGVFGPLAAVEIDDLCDQYQKEQDSSIRRALLEQYFRLRQEEAFVLAKDEIIAIKREGEPALFPWGTFFKPNGACDYFADLRDDKRTIKGEKYDPSWPELFQKILVKEYQEGLRLAVKSFNKLTRQGGYSKEEAIALLMDAPLSKWPKAVRRQLVGMGL